MRVAAYERVRVSKPYIPVSSSPPVAPEGLEKAESTLPMDLAREASTAAPRDDGIYLEYRLAAKALAWCKYLADPHAHVEGGIPAGP